MRSTSCAYAQLLEQWQVGRQQGFADVEARVARFFEQGDPVAPLGQQRRRSRPGRAAPDHQDVAVVAGRGGLHGARQHGTLLCLLTACPRMGLPA